MITTETIENNLKHCDATDIPDSMVGAAILLNPDGSQHAAIFVRYKGDSKLFHFDGSSVIMEDVSGLEDYYQKNLEFIPPILLPSFLAQCELILDKAQPKFGYFYEGSVYDPSGNFKSPTEFPEYMTCVGFCLNVINGFLSDELFLQYDDWDEKSLTGKMEQVELFIEKIKTSHPGIKMDDFKPNLRRIMPIEYVAGAFTNFIPVRKFFTDEIHSDLQSILKTKRVA